MYYDTQHLSDEILLDRIFTIFAAKEVSNSIEKNAQQPMTVDFVINKMKSDLRSFKNKVVSDIKRDVEKNGVGWVLGKYLVDGLLFSSFGWIGKAFQIAFSDEINKLQDQFISFIKSKSKTKIEAFLKTENSLNKIAYEGKLFREMNRFDIKKEAAGGPAGFLASWLKKSPLGLSVFKKFFSWAAKLFILALGGLGVAKFAPEAAKQVGVKSKTQEDIESEKNVAVQEKMEDIGLGRGRSHTLKPSGKGQAVHSNDNKYYWKVPLVGGSIPATAAAWAKEIYPELKSLKQNDFNTPSFNKVVSILANSKDRISSSSMIMPQGLHTRKSVVDIFAADLQDKLKEKNETK